MRETYSPQIVEAEVQSAWKKADVYHAHEHAKDKNGKEKPKFYVRISTIPWFAKGEIVAVISFYDLHKALQLEQMQQDFVANASHELRTPLSIISGFIETLQTTAKDDEKARDKFLHIMQEQTSYMSALIENLLSLSKIELSISLSYLF